MLYHAFDTQSRKKLKRDTVKGNESNVEDDQFVITPLSGSPKMWHHFDANPY